ncbi:MAG TPA: PASTA domain-containing protein [Micromonosporaceae bacterium]
MVDDRHLPDDGQPGDVTPGDDAARAGGTTPGGGTAPGPGGTPGDATAQWTPEDEEDTGRPADPWAGRDEEPEVAGESGAPTTVLPPTPPDATNVLPPPDTARWAARAEVPPPRPVATESWVEEPPPPRRSWWPVLIGLLILVLLALIAIGVWLALRGDRPVAPPSPTGTPSASPSASPTPTRSLTPSSAPTTTQTVVIPPLVGVPVDDAAALLDQAGLRYRIQRRVDGSVPAGTVLATNPAAGAEVPVGSQVTLVVASAPAPPPSPTTVSPAPRPSTSVTSKGP